MTNNSKAVITLIRNKLNSNMKKKEKLEWFAEKGVEVKNDKDLFFLKQINNVTSELTSVCNGLIFRGSEVVSYPGEKIKETTLEDLILEKKFIFNEKTYFSEVLNGIQVNMFWDPELNNWNFSGQNKLKTPYEKRLKKELYNIMASETRYTFCFKIIEQSQSAGIYLESIYNNKTFKEMPWKEVYKFAIKMKVLHPKLYSFEGIDNLEDNDFPLIARDISGNKFLIKSIK